MGKTFQPEWFVLSKQMYGNSSPTDFLTSKGFDVTLKDIEGFVDDKNNPIQSEQHYAFCALLTYLSRNGGNGTCDAFETFYSTIDTDQFHQEYTSKFIPTK